MSDTLSRFAAIRAKINDLHRQIGSWRLGIFVETAPSALGPGRKWVELTDTEARELAQAAYALLEEQGLSDWHHARVTSWCERLCAHVGLKEGREIRDWLSIGLGFKEDDMSNEEVIWGGGEKPAGPSRYDMNLDPAIFPGGRYDLTAITADEVDDLIDGQGGERRLDALLAIAEDAGVAADEIELVVKVGKQLVKQAIRAAKAVT